MTSRTVPPATVTSGMGTRAFACQTANALTAILLHAEAIQRRATGGNCNDVEIAASARHIARNARRAWEAIEAAARTSGDQAP